MSTEAAINLEDLPTLRQQTICGEKVYQLEDPTAYRQLCERLLAAGYDFPQCLSGVDMEYGLRTVLHLRRLSDQAELTLWLDVPYDRPHVPSVSDLWGGVDWHEREAYDLVGIHYDGHEDLRRILLEDHWTIHPLQRRYDTGGYLIPDWQAKPWPDWDAIAKEKEEAARKAAEAAEKRAAAAKAKAAKAVKPKEGEGGAKKPPLSEVKKTSDQVAKPKAAQTADDLTKIKGIGAHYVALLKEQGITRFEQLANLSDDEAKRLEEKMNFKDRIAREQWREQARALQEGKS